MILKKRYNFWKLSRRGAALFLAYDQGIEHGPTDFNDKNVDPRYIIEIARKGKFTGLIFQKGVAEKYLDEIKKSKVPLILKLNGKTRLVKGEPISRQLASVSEAIELRARAVGYTIYLGSAYESEMLAEFEKIQREAHKAGLPVVAWIYPRGKSVKGKKHSELLAYSARVGLEIGADIIKLHWNGKSKKDISWAVKSAGRAKVVIAGGKKQSEKKLLEEIRLAKQAGIFGLAIGRNIWQNKNPLLITEKIKKIIFSK